MRITLRPHARILVGMAAAVGALGAASMLSAAAAPSARADDYTEIVNAVSGDFTDGQAAYTSALADFGSSNLTDGLTQFFNGLDDDALSAPNNLIVGSIEALANESITGSEPIGLIAPADFSDALTSAESVFSIGETYFTNGATEFAAGAYGEATLLDLFAADYVSVVPVEELLLGAAASF